MSRDGASIEQIRSILKTLNSTSQSIEASSVMSRDGLTIASVMDERVDPDRLGAMCASMLSLASKTAGELGRGSLRQVLVEGEKGYLLAVHIGQEAVLSVVSRPESNLGMVFVETKKAAQRIVGFL